MSSPGRTGWISLIVAALLTGPTGCGPDETEAERKVVDLGRVAAGQPVFREFRFDNASEEDWTIASVRSSCSCTAPIERDGSIEAGSTAEVPVELRYDPVAAGPAESTVLIEFENRPPLVVTLRSNVVRLVPDEVILGTFIHPRYEPPSLTEIGSTLHRGDGTDWIVSGRSMNAYFHVEVGDPEAGSVYLRPNESSPYGSFTDQIALKTHLGEERVIRAHAHAKPPIHALPAQVLLDYDDDSRSWHGRIEVDERTAHDTKFVSATVDRGGQVVELNTALMESGHREVTWTWPAEGDPGSVVSGELELRYGVMTGSDYVERIAYMGAIPKSRRD